MEKVFKILFVESPIWWIWSYLRPQLSLFFPWEWLPNIFFPLWNFVRSLVSGFDGFHKSPTCSQAPFQFGEKFQRILITKLEKLLWESYLFPILAAKINLVWILNPGIKTSQRIFKGQKCPWSPHFWWTFSDSLENSGQIYKKSSGLLTTGVRSGWSSWF